MTESLLAAARRVVPGLIVAAACMASACDEPLRDITGPSPNLQPTFQSIRAEVFETTDLAGRVSDLLDVDLAQAVAITLPSNSAELKQAQGIFKISTKLALELVEIIINQKKDASQRPFFKSNT